MQVAAYFCVVSLLDIPAGAYVTISRGLCDMPKGCLMVMADLFDLGHGKNKNLGVQAMVWKTIWTIFGEIQSYIEPFRAIWGNLVPFGEICSFLEPFKAIWSLSKLWPWQKQEPRGSSHGLEGYLDHIWRNLQLFGAI